MKFAIQHNLMNAAQLEQVFNATANYPHEYVGVIPFSREITSNTQLDGVDYIPYGSTLLTTIASDLGWKGLHFDLNVMNYEAFCDNHPLMLNSNVVSVLEAFEFLCAVDPSSVWFIRPSEDLKQFSGTVMTAGEIAPWLKSMMDAVGGGSYYMDPTKQVVLCRPKEIQAEWRWFIVGGKIVSGSMYKAHNQLRQLQENDAPVIAEAQSIADLWLPHQCVVMDTALVDNQIKVVEFNCINASGFYKNDIPAIFDALWEFHQS